MRVSHLHREGLAKLRKFILIIFFSAFQNPLEVQVFVVNLKTKVKYDGPKLYLGKPLVGILDLWKPRRQPTECSDSMK